MHTIRVSIGTASVLGLAHAPMEIAPTTAYLMLGGRCAMNCAFCAQASQSQADDRALSRVTWPTFSLHQVCQELPKAEQAGRLRRCCIQVTAGKKAYEQTRQAVHQIRESTAMPLDVAILPAGIEQVQALLEAGVDHIGFGLDAACERVFRQVKRQNWPRMIGMIAETARRFPSRAAVHLIVGLGETEREMVERILWAHALPATVGLFAFTPIRGTALAHRAPPPLAQYRRMQAARWLIVHHGAGPADFGFDAQENLCDIRIAGWPALLGDGTAFRTSGCPDCNRPFYNERPGGTMYNYARPLTTSEAEQAIVEMELG